VSKTERLQVRLTEEEYEILSRLAADLGIDMSATVRFLIREKSRDRGIIQPPPAKKKRRAPG
jgi:predicted secreted protein